MRGHMKTWGGPLLWASVTAMLLAGCRGQTSSEPPIHLNPNMDNQFRFDPQEPNEFFADKRAMRPQVAGTVAFGTSAFVGKADFLKADDHMYRGRVNGQFATTLPPELELNASLLARGQERYNIYCAPCHDGSGEGRGMVVERGMLPPTSYHSDRIRELPVGQVYDVVTNGIRNMPAYSAQIPVKDRWAIVAYVRALQLSRVATIDQVPADVAAQKGWGRK